MSKLHRDNAGYVGCSYEETQDPYYSYNKLSLPLSQSDKTVVRDEVTFTVTVAGGRFVIDGTSQATVSLLEGNVYTFDQSDSSNVSHPLKFSYTADGTHGGGQEVTLGVTYNGTPGQSGAYTKIVVPFGLNDLKYYCGNHSGMGGSANVGENKAFTFARPILETSNAYGESGFTNSAVLKVGDPTSSTDNPFGAGNGHSVDFDGNDALRIAGGSIGTGDWTIEFWVKSASYGLERMVSAKQDSYSTERTNLRSYNGQWEFYAGDNPNTQSYSGTNISTNTWVHAAVVRSGTTISYYAAGSRLDTDTIDAAATTTLTEVDVAHGYGSEYFTGKISNVRVSDTARYSGTSYTTPSAGFTSDANTLLLAAHTSDVSTVAGTWSSGGMPGTALPGEDPFAANLVLAISGKNGFQDVSATIKGSGTNKAVTANGNATTSSSQGRYYGGGALQLDGSGDYFTIPNSSDFAFGTGDYTVEFWIKTTDQAFNILDIDQGGGWSTVVVNNNAPLFWQTNRANSNLYQINTNSDLIDGNWHHVAYVRKDGVHFPFIDGKQIGDADGYPDPTDYQTMHGNLQIGRGANGDLNGYLQDIRIYKGVAKYTIPAPSGTFGMDVIRYTGNGAKNNIGGTRWSSYISGIQFGTSYSFERAFDGDTDDRTFAKVGSGNLVFKPPQPIPVTTTNGLRLRIKADSTGNSGCLFVNGTDYSSSITSGSNWMTFNVSSLESIEFGQSTGNGSEQSSLAAIEIDGSILYNGTVDKIKFQPDLVWLKNYGSGGHHCVYDSVRGPLNHIQPSSNAKNYLESSGRGLSAFTSDGFTIDTTGGDHVGQGNINEDGNSYIAWCWRAGGAPTADNGAGAGNVPTAGSAKVDGANMTTALAGTIPAVRLTASTEFGFSVVKYQGSGSNGTVAHGLPSPAKWVIVKNLSTASTGWSVYHDAIGTSTNNYIELQQSGVAGPDNTAFQGTAPTGSVFSIGTKPTVNTLNDNYVAYCWSEVDNFSKFGSFSHDGSSGQTLDFGFKPRWWLVKEHDGGTNWYIFDAKRDYFDDPLYAENGNTPGSNWGFTFSGTSVTWVGGSFAAGNYLYAAFAESAAGEVFPKDLVDQLNLDDLSANSYKASNTGATWQTSVKKFYGGAVDVADGIITVANDESLRVSGADFTAECWVYADAAPAAGVAIYNHWGWSSNRRSWSLQGFNGGEVRFYTSTNGQSTTNVYIGTTMPVNQWFHLAGVVEGATMRLYVNGSLVGTNTTNSSLAIYDNTSDPIVIGDFSIPTGTRFDGKVQDCRLYKGIAKYSSSFTPPKRSVQGTARRYPSGVYVVS